MLERITHNWWQFTLRGLIAIIFGVMALMMPNLTLQALVLTFGIFAMADGFFAVFAGFGFAPFFNRWWAILLEGMTGILFGLLAIFFPAITGRFLLYFIAAWGLITGIFEIVTAIQFRRVIENEWMLILCGLLSIVFGVLVIIFPATGAVSLIWVIGVYAIAFGISEFVLSARMNKIWRNFKKIGSAGK